jgi:hypothetical protein
VPTITVGKIEKGVTKTKNNSDNNRFLVLEKKKISKAE